MHDDIVNILWKMLFNKISQITCVSCISVGSSHYKLPVLVFFDAPEITVQLFAMKVKNVFEIVSF